MEDYTSRVLMVMPNCGTFHYVGVVPPTADARRSGQWRLEDISGARRGTSTPASSVANFGARLEDDDLYDDLTDDRLVGLEPTLRITDDGLLLEASRRDRARIRSASVSMDARLLDSMQSGDSFYLARTHTADLAFS